MARFVRTRSADRDWVRRLPDPFSMEELRTLVDRSEYEVALSWLYDGIVRGRIEPMHDGRRITYSFVGARRAGDAGAAAVESVAS